MKSNEYASVMVDAMETPSEGYQTLPALGGGGASTSASSQSSYATGPLDVGRTHGYGTVEPAAAAGVTYVAIAEPSRKGSPVPQVRTHAYGTADLATDAARSHAYTSLATRYAPIAVERRDTSASEYQTGEMVI